MRDQKNQKARIALLMKIFLPACIIIAGIAGFNYLKSTKPVMQRKPSTKQATIVETISVTPGKHRVFVDAMGTVTSAKEITLKSKVAGEIIFTSRQFVKGGILQKGDLVLKIDDSDYKIEVKKAKAALEKAVASLAIEQGSQLIAKEEHKLINEFSKQIIDATDLALRKPQLIQANALVKSARADLEKAGLNLSRTRIHMPFDGLVVEKHVNRGSTVGMQGSICTLSDVEYYEIETQVPPDRLDFIETGEDTGSRAIVTSQYSNGVWEGKVVRKTGKMTDKSRMAGVIILIKDPLGLYTNGQTRQLLLDDYVDVKIQGKMLNNVFSIPRSVLREKNTLWIYNSGLLNIKKITPVWKGNKNIYVKTGLTPGDRIISSDLPAAVDGMAVKLNSKDGS